MLWIIPAWLLSVIAAFVLGYDFRGLTKRVEQLEEVVKSKVDKTPVIEEPQSTLIDPADPIQNAIYEHSKMMEKLNGK